MFKTFNEWVDYGSLVSFTETYESVLFDLEKRLQKENVITDLDNFWDNLMTLDKFDEFEKDLEIATSKFYEKTYIKGFDKERDEEIYTDEYHNIRKKIDSLKIFIQRHRQRERKFQEALLQNAIEKHWKEWKVIYKKWDDYIQKRKGALIGKRFGL